jgi:hypothetical protein
LSFYQIWQNMYHHDGLTFYYTLVWLPPADWHHRCDSATLKKPTHTILRFDSSWWQFWTNGWDPSSSSQIPIFGTRQNIPLPPLINKGRFHALRMEKSEAKDGKSSALFPNFFLFSRPTFPLLLYRVSIIVATTTHMSIFLTLSGMSPITLYLRLDKIPPHPPRGGHCIILHANCKIISMVVGPV